MFLEFIDYFFDSHTRRPEYIEANPRIGETVNGQLSGINLCELLVRLSAGDKLQAVDPVCTTTVGRRTQSFLMIMISKALALYEQADLERLITTINDRRVVSASVTTLPSL